MPLSQARENSTHVILLTAPQMSLSTFEEEFRGVNYTYIREVDTLLQWTKVQSVTDWLKSHTYK